jgi:hypothetical protein
LVQHTGNRRHRVTRSRMGMRRFTRLTNTFSTKAENLAHAVSLHYMHYNFACVHQSLTIKNDDGTRTKRTPAIAAGVEDHVWTASGDRGATRFKTEPLPESCIG